MNFFERSIAIISPSTALRRAANRAQIKLFERKFEAAAKGRRVDGWKTTKTSVNQDLQKELKIIRERTSDLSFNNPYGKKAVKTIANNVIGTGIIPSFYFKDGKTNEQGLLIIKQAWKDWADKVTCDFYGKSNLYGIQKLIMKTIVRRGEAIVIRKRVTTKVNAAGLQLQVLTGEFLDLDKNEEKVAGGGYIQNGIEYDKEGALVKYWLFTRHPSEAPGDSIAFEAKDVLHLYEIEEAGQNRGIPFGTTTVIKQRDLDEYEDAELVGKKVAASYAGFVTNQDPDKASNGEQSNIEAVEPGTMNYLAPGESVLFPNPPQNPGYSDYVRTQLRAIAAGYGITYEQLTGDLSGVNFSSGRMGWLESQRNFEEWQFQLMVPQFCDPVFAWFIESYKIGGTSENIGVSWTAPRREMIDPAKEIAAMKVQARAGFISWQEVAKSQGWNPQDLIEELKADQKLFQDGGLPYEWSPLFDPIRLQSLNKNEGSS
jgi:lambda family phage portal protein